MPLSQTDSTKSLSHKFKDSYICLQFVMPLEEPNYSYNHILSYLIGDRSKRYPSKKLMSQRCDELYAFNMDARASTAGNKHVLEVKGKCLNRHYADPETLEEALSFFVESIQEVYIDQASLNEAKINYLSSLKRMMDRPSSLGLMHALKGISEINQILIFSEQTEKIVMEMTAEDLKTYHQRLMRDAAIYCQFISEEDLKSKIDESFGLRPINDKAYFSFQSRTLFKNEVLKAIPQTQLTQIYRTAVSYDHPAYFAMRLMVIMLGGLPNSLLFQNIREKHSLSYSVSASSLNYHGLMVVQAGLADESVLLAKDLITKQIEKLKEQKFSQKLLDLSKKMLINSLDQTEDDGFAWLRFCFQQELVQSEDDLKIIKAKIQAVTKEDIQICAKELELISDVLIRGNENG